MNRERFKRVWPPVALFLLTLWFVALEPKPSRDPFAAISPAARWVSIHESPGKRFDTLSENPAVRDFTLLLGMPPFPTEGRARFLARELFPDTTLLIREPRMGPTLEPGWVLVSRVGARQTRLRLLKEFVGLQGFTFFDDHHGHSLWIQEKPGKPPRVAALVAGLFVVCEHPNPNAIRDVVDRIDGRRHTLRDVRPHLVNEWSTGSSFPDQGFWLGGPSFPEPFRVEANLENPGALSFNLVAEADWFGTDRAERHARAALLAGPRTLLATHLPPLPFFGLDVPSTLVVLGDPYTRSQSPAGLVTPLLLVPAENEVAARTRADFVMSALGRSLDVRWSVQPTQKGWRYVPREEFRRPMPLLGMDEPAAVWREDLLILGMSRSALDRLLARSLRQEAGFELRDVDWRDPETLAWMDGTGVAGLLEPLVAFRAFHSPPNAEGAARTSPPWEDRLDALSRFHFTATVASPHTFSIRMGHK